MDPNEIRVIENNRRATWELMVRVLDTISKWSSEINEQMTGINTHLCALVAVETTKNLFWDKLKDEGWPSGEIAKQRVAVSELSKYLLVAFKEKVDEM